MIKVKTFTTEMKMISASDTCTTDDKGATMGIVRTVAYEQ
jgi:hypothetical protein